jgi:hypothetical protein
LIKDEQFHLQRAKNNWALLGDRNTSYFHQAIVKRTRKNIITYLLNPDGSESTTQEQLSNTLTVYFQGIFDIDRPRTYNLNNISNSLMHAGNRYNAGFQSQATSWHRDAQGNTTVTQTQHQARSVTTNSKPTLQELFKIIKEMRSNASPGPDGLSAAFYKSAWPWVSNDVHKLVTDFYNSSFMSPEINQTFLVLIPKKSQPTVPQDFRPISLCNVAYKIIAKSLAERLKPYLPDFVDHTQAAFIKIGIFLPML